MSAFPNISQDMLPPHSNEAEQAVLGAILFDNMVYARVSRTLHAKHFYNPVHERIYGTISALIERGQLADAIVLKHRYTDEGVLADIGGIEYLALLCEQAPPPRTVPQYASLIVDASLRRSAIRAGQEMEATLYDQNSDDDAVTTVSKAIESLAGIARNGTGKAAFEDAGEALLSMLTRGRAPSVPTGLKALDRMSRMDRGALTVLAGLTSMGKSALAVEIARRVAAQGLRVRYFSLEMHSEQIGARWVSAQMVERGGRLFPPAGIPYNKIARHDELPLEAVDMIKAEGRNLPSVEIDPTQGLTVSEIIARACDGETPDLVVVDYLNKVRKGDMGDLRHDLQVEAICNRLRDFAKDANCAVLLLSQLNRKKTDGETLVPTMDDLKDSSGIEQAADTVWFVHRPAYHLEREAHRLDAAGESLDPEKREALNSLKPQMTVVVAKQRQGQIGPVQLVANMAHNFVTDTDWGHR